MFTQFATILIFLIIGMLLVPAMMLAGKILRPDAPDEKKLSTYECGEIPVGNTWVQFNLRFYVIAILFLIFEVEIVLMFPVATMFKYWMTTNEMSHILVFIEVAIFISILLVGFAYAWHKKDLEWIRPPIKQPGQKES